VSQGAVAQLVKLLDDPEDIVRSAAYNALIMLGKSAAGSKAGQGWAGDSGHGGDGGGGAGGLCGRLCEHDGACHRQVRLGGALPAGAAPRRPPPAAAAGRGR
jgi:hypothetical protein